MSLFPAYKEQADLEETQKPTSDENWLQNSSFQTNLISEQKSVETTTNKKEGKNKVDNTTSSKKRKKKHKHRESKKVLEELVLITENDEYKVDTSGARELLTVSCISRPSAPTYTTKYHLRANYWNKSKLKHKGSFKRYYKFLNVVSPEKLEVLTSKNITKTGFPSRDEHFAGFKHETELSEKTAFYNRYLAENPNDVNKWLEYIKFQDTVYEFEKTYRKGSIAKAQRVLAERKLSILEKALSHNTSDVLQRERLNIAVATFPSDELQVYLKNLVEKEKDNIVLWQGYIEATQCSMSHCNTPKVLNLYTSCLSTLHQLRRAASVERHLLEESILKMLYQCGLFLKQAGLFEQLWTLLRVYLELNLAPNEKNRFNFPSEFSQMQLIELEEVILNSNLPLHELWLRVEKLRESCHWLPIVDSENCEDPQRLVFPEDVAELIHPITMPENIFKLVATIFSLLKIPLLPCRHTTMGGLGLDYVPWNLDSIEPLLAVFLPLYPVKISKNLWNDTRLAVGPQFLKKIPGHEEYLDFILKLMENCTKCLNGNDKIALSIWFLRFQRLLIILDKFKLFVMTDSLKKQIKKKFKEFLKLEENRQNQIYYLEYALVEYEFGNLDSCLNIINTALKINEKCDINVENIGNAQTNWCHLYKELIHIKIQHLEEGSDKNDIIRILCKMVLQDNIELTQKNLMETEIKFETITKQLLKYHVEKISTVEHFLPNFFTDWVICNGWFLYLTNQETKSFNFLSGILQELENVSGEISWQKEVLYEFYVALLFKYSSDIPASGAIKLMDAVVNTSIEKYPNNIFILSVLEQQQAAFNGLGIKWWKTQNLLLGSNRAISSLFAVIIVQQQIEKYQEIVYDTITGAKYDVAPGLKSQLLSLFKKITSGTNTRKCGLIWRLYLQFVYSYFTPEICRNVYYSAVEECPWLKALYMDAAIYIPAELAQIQDLIIEKQLRLHVTPEELEVLRS